MAVFDTVIRGGVVATAADVFRADVGILDGKVAALGLDLGPAHEEIDASGRLVLPGGVDSHAHIQQKGHHRALNADTFATATASALTGGTTTCVCFIRQGKGESLAQVAADYAKLAAESRMDYAFHLMITDPRPEVLNEELPPLIAAGNRSIKIFLANEGPRITDAEALQVLAAARRLGAVVCIHCEHHDIMEFYRTALVQAGLTAPKYHAWSRPMLVESESVHRAIAMAEALDTPIQIFHVTGEASLREIARAQARGLKVWAETCMQYLTFTAEELDQPGFEGAKFICSPAFRDESEHEVLWNGLRTGVLSNVTSDHSPANFCGCNGKRSEGEDAPFTRIHNGIPGIAARLPLLFSAGVNGGRIDLTTFVAVSATNSAKIFGLWPRKGTIAIGSDADIAVWDKNRLVTLTNELMQHGADYTPYEGRTVRGWPVMTLLRGKVACREGVVEGAVGGGQRLAREPYAAMRPRGVFPTPFNPVDGVIEGKEA
jgi:dihydropyrimidinase